MGIVDLALFNSVSCRLQVMLFFLLTQKEPVRLPRPGCEAIDITPLESGDVTGEKSEAGPAAESDRKRLFAAAVQEMVAASFSIFGFPKIVMVNVIWRVDNIAVGTPLFQMPSVTPDIFNPRMTRMALTPLPPRILVERIGARL